MEWLSVNVLFVELICKILTLCFSFHQGTMSPSDSRWTMCGSGVPRQPLLFWERSSTIVLRNLQFYGLRNGWHTSKIRFNYSAYQDLFQSTNLLERTEIGGFEKQWEIKRVKMLHFWELCCYSSSIHTSS